MSRQIAAAIVAVGLILAIIILLISNADGSVKAIVGVILGIFAIIALISALQSDADIKKTENANYIIGFEKRLTEIDRMHSKGSIDTEDHEQMRKKEIERYVNTVEHSQVAEQMKVLDKLLAKGTISADEHKSIRQAFISKE